MKTVMRSLVRKFGLNNPKLVSTRFKYIIILQTHRVLNPNYLSWLSSSLNFSSSAQDPSPPSSNTRIISNESPNIASSSWIEKREPVGQIDPRLSILGRGYHDVRHFFSFGRVIGRGRFGTVRKVQSLQDNKHYACKSISKCHFEVPEDIEDIRREVQIMHHLNGHPNITLLRGTYEDKHNVHLIMDVCTGGELFDSIVHRGQFTEKDAASIMRTIISVVHHCHTMGVVHRDLKPENFLLESKQQSSRILCTDFGLSTFYSPGEVLDEAVGSISYVAPEVLDKQYGPQVDLWSSGIILYVLLSGYTPFQGKSKKEVYSAILNQDIDLQSNLWPSISEPAKECIQLLLDRDPEKRATAEIILQHPWMVEHGVAADIPLDNEILNRLNSYATTHKLKKEAMKIIACSMPADEIAGLKAIFESIDEDKSGTITAKELHDALTKKGSMIKPEDVQSLLALIDVDANGTIEYEEFLAATLSTHQVEKEENLRAAFAHFDANGDGIISREELQQGLRSGDMNIKESELEQILAEVDKDGNGEIDYNEFTQMLLRKEKQRFGR